MFKALEACHETRAHHFLHIGALALSVTRDLIGRDLARRKQSKETSDARLCTNTMPSHTRTCPRLPAEAEEH